MKKFFKKGFSLAEILIALGIISIISTMGMTVAKRGIDRAYNLYVYSSYKGIHDAINIANADATQDGNNGLNYDSPFGTNDDITPYFNSILSSLSASEENIPPAGNSIRFSTPNGVRYWIFKSTCDDGNCDGDTSLNPDHHANYVIEVTIPQRKTRNSSTATYCLLYQTNTLHELLLPINTGIDDEHNVVCTTSASLQNLANRRDLLPFFVDKGVEGRVLPNENGDLEYHRRNFISFQRAYCQIFAEDISYNNATVIDCAAPPADFESGLGTALLVSPQNL